MSEERATWAQTIAGLFAQNVLTVFGASLTTVSAILIFLLAALGASGILDAPYIGILMFMILPGLFVAGLLVIPVGAWWQRRRVRAGKAMDTPPNVFVIDLRKPRVRKALALVGFLTLINVGIVSAVTYEGYHYTESVTFCGQLCHTVMEPEFTAYQGSPHSRVRCTECHIGPGAPWFVRSKISGLRQVLAVFLDSYQRPIPTPVENLRPSRDTCEHCHWPQRFAGDRVKVKYKYSEDEANTRLTTALILHIGGGNSQQGGIHSWHIDPRRNTLYLPTDKERQEISLIRVKESDGTIKNYATESLKESPESIPDEAMRTMDCIDCHNRPTHVFKMAAEALDDSLTAGRIDKSLPYIKKLGGEALNAAPEAEGPETSIDKYIREYYAANNPDLLKEKGDAVSSAIAEVQAVFNRNVFPEMKVSWGTYTNNLGHVDFPGCFRCHDDEHKTSAGDSVPQDCTICHSVLAWEEENPEVVANLGIE